MTDREILDNMLNNLNSDGMRDLIFLFEGLDRMEKYNINTTPERLEKLKQKDLEEEAKYQEELIQQKAKQDKKETERQRILTNNKKFLDLVDSINPGRYAMSMDEMQALYASKYHDTFRLIYNSFKAGFLKGQKAERARCRRNSTKS